MKKNILVLSTAVALFGLGACQSMRSTPNLSGTDSLMNAGATRTPPSVTTNSSQVTDANTPAGMPATAANATPANTGVGVSVNTGTGTLNNANGTPAVGTNGVGNNRTTDTRTTGNTMAGTTGVGTNRATDTRATGNNMAGTPANMATGQPTISEQTGMVSNNSVVRSDPRMNADTAAKSDMMMQSGVSKEASPTVNSYLSRNSRSGNTSGKSFPNNPENSVNPPMGDSLQKPQAQTTPDQRNGINATEAMTARTTNVEKNLGNTRSSQDLMTRVNQQLDKVDQELKMSPTQMRRTELNKNRQTLVNLMNTLKNAEMTLSQMESSSTTPKK